MSVDHSFLIKYFPKIFGLIAKPVKIVTAADEPRIKRYSILPVIIKRSVVPVTSIKLPGIIRNAALNLFLVSKECLFININNNYLKK